MHIVNSLSWIWAEKRKKVIFRPHYPLSRMNPGNCGIFCLLNTTTIFIFSINGFWHTETVVSRVGVCKFGQRSLERLKLLCWGEGERWRGQEKAEKQKGKEWESLWLQGLGDTWERRQTEWEFFKVVVQFHFFNSFWNMNIYILKRLFEEMP